MAVSEGSIQVGSDAFRRANLALFCAGFVTFMTLYDVQPLLPLFCTGIRGDACHGQSAALDQHLRLGRNHAAGSFAGSRTGLIKAQLRPLHLRNFTIVQVRSELLCWNAAN